MIATRASWGIAIAVGAFSLGCSSGSDAKQQKAQAASPRAVSVATAPVQKQDVPVYLTGLGAVTAFNTANIKSRIDGQIVRVNFREGQNVNQGELLIEIDSRPYQAQLDQMQAQLFRDQAQLRDAKLNLDRYTALIPSGSIAQQQVDTQRALADQLEGTVRTDQAGAGERMAAMSHRRAVGCYFALVKAVVDRAGATGVREVTGQRPARPVLLPQEEPQP